jgi:hypothetical protein
MNLKHKRMSNNKQTWIDWFFDQLEEKGDLRETPSIRNVQLNIDTSDYMELKQQARKMYKAEIEQAELDAKEIVIIKQCAEESTSEASAYSRGYTEGYKRAVDYMTDTLKNKIEIKVNGSNTNIASTIGSSTTTTTKLCAVFVPKGKYVFDNRCKNCGKEPNQHPIISNT